MTLTRDDGQLAMYHVGLVVADLATAVEKYGDALELKFAAARDIELPVVVDGRPRTVRMLATYSIDGPPYLELIEERAGSTWAADAFGMNHMGFWAEDMPSAMARLEANGLPGRVRDTSCPPRVSYHQAGAGMWVELVSPAVRETLDAWLATSYR